LVARYTLHATRYTLHAARCTLHAARCTLHAGILYPPFRVAHGLHSAQPPPLRLPEHTIARSPEHTKHLLSSVAHLFRTRSTWMFTLDPLHWTPTPVNGRVLYTSLQRSCNFRLDVVWVPASLLVAARMITCTVFVMPRDFGHTRYVPCGVGRARYRPGMGSHRSTPF
jgi:hypothetical protein